MHLDNLEQWQHDHSFGQDKRRLGEGRTILVIAITATMMVVEITAGILFGSMALLADGLHMASHAVALGVSAFAYVYARRHARDERFSFGTGKVNALGGFTGAVLLGVFALMMVWGSVERMLSPVEIAFNQAILVAFIGLVVNGLSALVLGHGDHHHHHHGHDHHEHDHHHHHHEDHGHGDHEHYHHHDHDHSHDHSHEHDHNLRAAYLHVLADALTSVLAIVALVAAKYLDVIWMDPLMGIVGALLIAKWSLGLLRITSEVLLDGQGPEKMRQTITQALEGVGEDRVTDLHLWSIGPGIYASEIALVTHHPKSPDHYKGLLPDTLPLVHVSVEVHQCDHSQQTTASCQPVGDSGQV